MIRDTIDRLARSALPWRLGVAVSVSSGALSGGLLGGALPAPVWDLLIFGPAAALAALLLAARVDDAPRPGFRGVAAALTVLVAIAAASAAVSADPARVLAQSAVFAVMALFLLATWRARWGSRSRLILDLVVVGAVTAGWSLLSLALGAARVDAAFGDHGRLTGVFVNPNALGMLAAFTITGAVALSLALRGPRRVALLVLLVPLLVTLVWTGSRGSAAGLLVGVIVTLVVRRAWRSLAAALALGVGIAAAVVAGAGWLLDRSQYGDITSGRLTLYTELLERWAASPLLGIGYRMSDTANRFELPAHNILLSALVETGVIGFAAFVAVLVLLVRAGRIGPLFGVATAIFALEQTESSLFGWGGPTAVSFWLALIGYGAWRDSREDDF